MKKADLHIHTTASDGLFTPEEVLKWAFARRLSAISITDHDTVKGIESILIAQKNKGQLGSDIEIIPGIELNCEFNGDEIHILGYYIDYKEKWFLDKLTEIQYARYNRAIKMLEILNLNKIDINLGEVMNTCENGLIGRPHIARLMVEKNYVTTLKGAFDKYIGKDAIAYVERFKLSCQDAIEMIKKIGGILVLAHPGLIKNKECIGQILNLGIEGIEVYHSKHNQETSFNLMAIAKSRKLLITGGSDCHGTLMNGCPILGTITIDYQHVEELKKHRKY